MALSDAPIVETDDFASWDNQFDWWPAFEQLVLGPLARGETARYPSHDWRPRRFRGDREVGPAPTGILEGIGSGRRAITDRLSFLVWVETAAEVRLRRGLDRDGLESLTDWQTWMAAEDGFFAADRTPERADATVTGSGMEGAASPGAGSGPSQA